MATHASALKAHKQSLKNRDHNRAFRARLRGALKSIRTAIDGNDLTAWTPDIGPGRALHSFDAAHPGIAIL